MARSVNFPDRQKRLWKSHCRIPGNGFFERVFKYYCVLLYHTVYDVEFRAVVFHGTVVVLGQLAVHNVEPLTIIQRQSGVLCLRLSICKEIPVGSSSVPL